MRHRVAHRKLGRVTEHRIAMLRNQAHALLKHERIETTVPRAKELRPFVERIISIAKRGVAGGAENGKSLHARRMVIARLGSTSNAEVQPEGDENTADHRRIVVKLFDDIAPRYKERAGGYTRIIKRHERRLGDAGRTAFLELLKEGESKVRAKQPAAAAPAPAPKVKEEDTLSDLPQYSSESAGASSETTTSEQPASAPSAPRH